MILVGSPQAAARREHRAEIVGQSFVAPQQVGLHRLLEVGCRQVRGTAIFAIPRMHKLVRQQPAERHAGAGPEKGVLRQAAVVGLVMLEPKVGHVIAESEQEMVVAIVARAEELARFGDQVGHRLLVLRRSCSVRLRCRRPCRSRDESARPAA